MTSPSISFVLLGPDDYERAKKVLNAAKHPGFVGREQFFRCATRGRAVIASLDGRDVGVVLVDHKHTLGTLSVVTSAQGAGIGAALVDNVQAKWVKAIADKVAWFERRGYKPVGAPEIGASGKMSTQLMQRSEDPSAWNEAHQASAELRTPAQDAANLNGGWQTDVLGCLEEIDLALVRAKEHAISPWWWERIREFYGSKRWLFVGRVGRRGGKSDTWAKVAIAEILSCRHKIPAGDTGIVSIVSSDREEASKRVKTIVAYLTILNVDHKSTAYSITFSDRPYAVEVKTASVRGVSGFTSILCIGDEVDKWHDNDTGANPADAVLSSWRPTLATTLAGGARMALLSSPWLYDGPHSREFERGTNDDQQAEWAPTWVAHPALTPEVCRRLEPNAVKFRREYEAIPQPDGDADGEHVKRATRVYEPATGRTFVAVLYACPKTARWLLLVTTRRKDVKGDVRTAVAWAQSWPASAPPRDVMRDVRDRLQAFELEYAYMPDDTPPFAARLAARMEMRPSRVDETGQVIESGQTLALVAAKVLDTMHADLRMRFAADEVEIVPDTELREDVLSVKRVGVDDMGRVRYDARGFAVCLALACAKTVVGPAEKAYRAVPGSREWWEQLAKEEERRDYAQMRARNEQRAEGGHDWVADMRRGIEGYEDGP